MSRRKGPRHLRPEEAALWEVIAARTKPLHPERRTDPVSAETALPPTVPEPKPPLAPFAIGEKARPALPAHDLARPIASVLAAAPVAMDRKAHRKLTRGKLSPEARIDLHGMTLADAHPALIRFVGDCHARGLRLVLVITGKGRSDSGGGPFGDTRGILRRQVPHWLTMAPLGPLVLQVVAAHQRHGGSGAFYVYLRRR